MLGALWCWPATSSAALETAAPSTDVVSGTWQHRQLTFNYFGVTALYTCDGLEDHVRQILLHLGARKDIKVSATGCTGASTPSRDALVSLDFYTLAPAADASGTVNARWAPLEMTPLRPRFMGGGDCELIQEMKDLITQNFSLRNLDYRTRCPPHGVTIDAFEVRGQALRAMPTPKAN
jgi:hypothetical protein